MRWLPAIVAILSASGGCATCHHRAGDLALETERCPEVEACRRANVHAVVVKGFDPLDVAGTGALVEALVESGFAKVYRLESHHASFMEREIRSIAGERPGARFVIVGSGSGASLARHLAGRIAGAGGTVDALIEVDPVHPRFLGDGYSIPAGTNHRVVGRLGRMTGPATDRSEYRIVTGLGITSSCVHPEVVDLVKSQLVASSHAVALEEDATTVSIPLLDHPAPLPGERKIQAGGNPRLPAETVARRP